MVQKKKVLGERAKLLKQLDIQKGKNSISISIQFNRKPVTPIKHYPNKGDSNIIMQQSHGTKINKFNMMIYPRIWSRYQ